MRPQQELATEKTNLRESFDRTEMESFSLKPRTFLDGCRRDSSDSRVSFVEQRTDTVVDVVVTSVPRSHQDWLMRLFTV